MYDTIVRPTDGKLIQVNSSEGKNIISNYLNLLGGALGRPEEFMDMNFFLAIFFIIIYIKTINKHLNALKISEDTFKNIMNDILTYNNGQFGGAKSGRWGSKAEPARKATQSKTSNNRVTNYNHTQKFQKKPGRQAGSKKATKLGKENNLAMKEEMVRSEMGRGIRPQSRQSELPATKSQYNRDAPFQAKKFNNQELYKLQKKCVKSLNDSKSTTSRNKNINDLYMLIISYQPD